MPEQLKIHHFEVFLSIVENMFGHLSFFLICVCVGVVFGVVIEVFGDLLDFRYCRGSLDFYTYVYN